MNWIVEIPLEEVRSEHYKVNAKRCGKKQPCLICGKAIKDESKAKYVQLLTNGNIVSSTEKFENSQGQFPVGTDCAKKLVINFAF